MTRTVTVDTLLFGLIRAYTHIHSNIIILLVVAIIDGNNNE